MSYEQFAYLYDELMNEAPYDRWVEFVKTRMKKYKVSGVRLLDLACGTGELSVRLAREGFKVSGVDLSPDMLAVAQAKAEAHRVHIPFYEQDMRDIDGQGEFDVVTIFCDSLNYLPEKNDVNRTFAGVSKHLTAGGLFLFDVHSVYKIDRVFMNHSFSLNDDEIAYIWDSFPGKEPHSVEHELSFFVLDERSGKYDRIDEVHEQRTFLVQEYSSWLAEAGFELLEISADFKNEAPKPDSERIFFTAQKKG